MLRPTFLGFDTARRGLSTSQKGIDITGQNLVNWDSAGYTRQRVEQVAVAPSAYSARYSTNRIGVAGQGVDISGIAQTRDKFLDKRFRDEYADAGYYDESKTILADIESALGEFQPESDTGLRGALSSMFNALQDFSGNPYSATHANIVLTEFKNMTQTLHQLDSKLKNVASQQKYDLKISVDEVNNKLQQIAELNRTISEDLGIINDNAHYGPNELLDQRNLLLDELSGYADIDVQNNVDGTVTVKMNGLTVVEGKRYETMKMVENDNGTVSLQWLSSGDTVNLGGGALKAATDYINGRGPNMIEQGETGYRGIRYYQDKLDTFARTLVGVVNSVIPDTQNGGTKMLLGALSDQLGADGQYHVTQDIPVTAANISVSDEWSNNPSYVMYEGDSKENNYALALSNALVTDDATFTLNGEVFTGSFLEYVDDYSSTLAEDWSFNNSRHTAASEIVNTLNDQRDAVSGVSIDEEASNIMLYQKSYQAAARLMTALDELLDVLINNTGLVGR